MEDFGPGLPCISIFPTIDFSFDFTYQNIFGRDEGNRQLTLLTTLQLQ